MRVLAALDNTDGARPVAEFAAALARVLAADADAIHVRCDGSDRARAGAAAAQVPLTVAEGEPATSLRREAEADDVAAVVIGRCARPSTSPVGAVACELVTALSKPVAVVPAETAHPGRLGRVVVPLEGTEATSLAPRRTIALARDAGLEIVLVHVFDSDSLPLFTDQPHHETATWAHEFLARYSPCPPEDVRLEVRVGQPEEHVVTVAREIDADLIALGWSQELAAGRAGVVRAVLERARLPIFLIPVVAVEPAGASVGAASAAGGP
jgi:nucleotide-binding universal stress UspA family protein